MFIFFVAMRVMAPANWIAVWRRAVKLERMERRLQDWNHNGYAAERQSSKYAKTFPGSTC